MTHDEIELLKEMVLRAEDTIGWFCESPTCNVEDCQERREDMAKAQRAKELLERLENAQ